MSGVATHELMLHSPKPAIGSPILPPNIDAITRGTFGRLCTQQYRVPADAVRFYAPITNAAVPGVARYKACHHHQHSFHACSLGLTLPQMSPPRTLPQTWALPDGSTTDSRIPRNFSYS